MAAEASATPGASRVTTEKRTEDALMYVLIFSLILMQLFP